MGALKHASLVFGGANCVGGCQFGSPQKLPRTRNARAYHAANPTVPEGRIRCFFSGKGCAAKVSHLPR